MLPAMTNRRLILGSLGLALVSWAGLALVILYVDPRVAANRLLFLVLLFLGLSSTLIPLLHLIQSHLVNRETGSSDILRSARRSGLLALFFVLCAWMRMNQALNWTNAFLLSAALVLVEVLMSIRGG